MNRADFLAGTASAALLGANAGAALPRRVRFGANYVPSRTWWYLWSDWDPDGVRRDLHDVAALGMDHIRIQLLWPEFQPNAAAVSAQNLSRLLQLLDMAHEVRLDVEVTVLDGQLSGFLFVPPYLIDNRDGRVRNFIVDAELVQAQVRLFDAIAREVAAHPRFLGFDIANEIYWFTQPLHVAFSPAQGDAWMQRLLSHCERVAPGKMHVNGVDKWPYEAAKPQGFTRRALARAGAASVVHPWAGFGPIFPRYGPLSTAATHYAEFLVQYMQAFSAGGRRPMWIEEDGCSKVWMREELIPHWAQASIRNAASCDHLFGITWWCSHDVNPHLRGFNRLEYDLGLYTNDRQLKPLGRAISDLIDEFDRTPPQPLRRERALVIPDDEGSDALLARYVRSVDEGVRPQIVLASRTNDLPYLRERGISELIR
ncbi:MAG TPA: hypothetical protein VJP85_01805 [Candidatus Baltobacteraceae bacterium]|nr:hypothetical protein [Candidatus Baltobacteraceae bacterium]